MKNLQIKLICDPDEQEYFWIQNILDGIRSVCNANGDKMIPLSPGEISLDMVSGEPVLLIGAGNLKWREDVIRKLLSCHATPLIINAGIIPLCDRRLGGVEMGLEDIIGESICHLRSIGKSRTALFGVSNGIMSDYVKCAAFCKYTGDDKQKDVYYADASIEQCADDFVTRLTENRYDSVLCSNDTVAICLSHRLTERGISVPDPLAIIGFGNSFIGENLPVPLTSIDCDYIQMGREAVRLAHIVSAEPSDSCIRITLPCYLHVRASTDHSAVKSYHTMHVSPSPDINIGDYFKGNETDRILSVETLYRSCNKVDQKILQQLALGKNTDEIAAAVFLTDRAVRYRLENLVDRYGFSSKNELVQHLIKYTKSE